MLLNCSECRKKLQTIDKFVNERYDKSYEYISGNVSSNTFTTRSLSSSLFGYILLRPIILVLKKFLEEMDASTQRQMIHNRG